MSPGWQSSAAQMRSSVSKRTPLTLPDLSSDTFCSVMPMRSASSFERILRRASMTSRLTTIAMVPSHDLRVVVGDLGRGLEDVGERQQEQREDQVQQILRQEEKPARRHQRELPEEQARDEQAGEQGHPPPRDDDEAGAAQAEGGIDGEDAAPQRGAAQPPHAEKQ